MRRKKIVNVASICHSNNHRKQHVKLLSVLVFVINAAYLLCFIQVFQIPNNINLPIINAFSVTPKEISISQPQFIDDDDDDYYKRYNSIQRRDVLDLVRCSTFASVIAASTACHALTPTEAQQKYDIYAPSYDQIDGGIASELLGIDIARKSLIQQVRGKVLEVGVGTGLNLQYYNSNNQITSLDLVDISDGMLQVAMGKGAALSNLLNNIPINFIRADMTTQLVQKFGLESYDTIVDTFSMCVLGDVGTQQCLDQMSRVIRRDGGQILLLENSRSSNPFLGKYQDVTADTAANVGGRGCIYNQNIRELIQANDRIQIIDETEYATGLFRSFRCTRII